MEIPLRVDVIEVQGSGVHGRGLSAGLLQADVQAVKLDNGARSGRPWAGVATDPLIDCSGLNLKLLGQLGDSIRAYKTTEGRSPSDAAMLIGRHVLIPEGKRCKTLGASEGRRSGGHEYTATAGASPHEVTGHEIFAGGKKLIFGGFPVRDANTHPATLER
jgi:hypothetical protein